MFSISLKNQNALYVSISTFILTSVKMNLHKQNFNAISKNVQPYNNFIVDTINDHCLRMAVMEGEYRWHYHKHTDELFLVLEGELKIEIKDGDTMFLKPGSVLKFPPEQFIKQVPRREL